MRFPFKRCFFSLLASLFYLSFARAATFEGFVYEVASRAVTITAYEGSAPEVEIPATIGGRPVTAIGDWAFSNHSGLTSVTISDSVTRIGDYAFTGCSSLASLALGDGVASIGAYVFLGCSRLTDVSIPATVASIGPEAFGACPALQAIEVSPANPTFSSIGGVLFDHARQTLLAFPGGWEGAYEIPGSVSRIGAAAFASSFGLTRVTIPDAVTTIEARAFADCSHLAEVQFGQGVTVIGEGAFQGCSSLTRIALPAGVEQLGPWAFAACTLLAEVVLPEGLAHLGDNAFFSCSSLQAVAIPDSVTSVGQYAFADCLQLRRVTIGHGLTRIADRTFSGCRSLVDLSLGRSLASIGKHAFADCTGLTRVTIPVEVAKIELGAFSGCASLAAAVFTGALPVIQPWAFDAVASDFRIYYPARATTDDRALYWLGYPAELVPAASIWALSHGVAFNDALFDADPDQDGLANVFEYALGTSPAEVTSAALAPRLARSNQQLVYTHRRLIRNPPTIAYWWTTDLSLPIALWTPFGAVPVVTNPDADGDGQVEEVAVPLPEVGNLPVFIVMTVAP
ncbi:MAG: leucine-rich repeat domain-containing protein [Verrucomicrobiota bacterium JB022]|nr:leucine-rich repeat domain-containing protein [Verrucomicrobiota bacterium JB022]